MLSPGLRSAIGPLCIGLAVWCAAGQISVAAHDMPQVRIASPAPWWAAVIAGLLAAVVPAWRRRPALAAPALLSSVPWWPVPMPAAGLLWSGPLAWLPIGLAVLAAVLDEAGRRSSSARPRAAAGAGRAWLAAAALTFAIGFAAAWSLDPRIPGGDEPHYLVITQSLIKDGDLRIENNHRARDYAAFYAGTLAPDVIRRGRDGQIYSIHAPGLSVLVLPAFWLFGYRGAQATVLVAAALAGGLVWLIGWRAAGSKPAAWFAWAGITGSATSVVQSATIFPDGPAALGVAAGIYVMLRLRPAGGPSTPVSGPMLAGVSGLVAALPWLHTRFAVLAAGFGVLIAWTIARDRSRAAGARSRRLAWFLAVPAASALAWFAFFQAIYGTPNPAAPYGDRPEASWWFVPGGLAGLLFDQQFGLMAYTPVLAAVFAGAGFAAAGPVRQIAVTTMAAAGVYLVAVTTYWMWYAGVPATPARFAAAILPAFAAPLALMWSRAGNAGRAALVSLLAVSLAITGVVVGVDRGALAWNVRGPAALWLEWLGPVVDLARGWPGFFWKLSPEDLSTEVPFFVHVGSWLALVAAVAAIGRLLVRRTSAPVVVTWCAAIGLMSLVQIGWWLNRVAGPEPIRSQLAVLDSQRAGRRIFAIAPMSVRAIADLAGIMRIRPGETAPPGAAVWGAVRGLPAGTYELRVVSTRPRQGELALRIGRAERPWRTLTVLPLSRQAFVVTVPVDVAAVTIEPDQALRQVGGTIEIAPLAIRRGAPAEALSVVRYGSIDVFFLDQAAYVEPDGFWVQGGRATEVVIAAGAGVPSLELMLRNGNAPNDVQLQSAAEVHPVALQPGEQRLFPVRVPADGVVRLRVASESGFRPSDAPGGDRRYLGVWIGLVSGNPVIR